MSRQRANDLDGRAWTLHSLSIWSDIRKTREEIGLGCPALFPAQLVERLLRTFLPGSGRTVLDPFAGSGSAVITAARCGHRGLGLELSADFVQLARLRLQELAPDSGGGGTGQIWQADAHNVLQYVPPESVDLVVTSPPYWDVLSRRRSADHRPVRDYQLSRTETDRVGQTTPARIPNDPPDGAQEKDLSHVADYEQFLQGLQSVFAAVYQTLRRGAHCLVIVMDLRKGGRFYPFHADLAQRLQSTGFTWEDVIIWDRRQEYHRLRPLGYPWVFRVNKVHEYILIFRRPPRA